MPDPLVVGTSAADRLARDMETIQAALLDWQAYLYRVLDSDTARSIPAVRRLAQTNLDYLTEHRNRIGAAWCANQLAKGVMPGDKANAAGVAQDPNGADES